MRYAALKALTLIVLGIIFSQYINLSNPYLLIFFVLSIILAFFTKGYSLYFALFLVSALNFNIYKARQTTIENFPVYDVNVKIQAQIIETPIQDSNPSRRYIAELLKINNASVSGKVFLFIDSLKLSYGDVIEVNSKIIGFDFPRNPNLIDYNKYYHKQGYLGAVFILPTDIETIIPKQGKWLTQHLVLPMRYYFFKTIDKYLDGDEKDLLLGILLGEKRGMSKTMRATFADAGVAHILAVSGLHIWILIGILLLLLIVVQIRDLPAFIIIIIITMLYISLIGYKTPAIRAGLMAIFAIWGLFLERRYEPINGVFVAAIIILLVTPQALTEVSFQLSFSATVAIILVAPRIYNCFKHKKIPSFTKKYLIFPFAISLSALIGIGPILLYHFFRLPVLSVFANLIIVPLVAIATPLGFLVVLINLFWHGLAGIFANTLWLCLKLIILVSSKFANLSFATIEPGRPSILLIILFYLGVLLILFWKNLRFRKISLAIILVGLNFIIWHNNLQPKQFTITFLDIKQGDAIFFDLPNGRKMLIDAGDVNEIIPLFLKSKGIKNIDLAIITHPHLDHYGGYKNLINDINIKQFLIATRRPKDTLKDTMYTNLINNINRKGINITCADQGQIIEGLGIKAEVLLPNSSIRRIYNMNALDPNDISIVLKIEYENKTLLFPGDLDDTELIADLPIQAQILKSPHHGSKKANNKLLFDLVKPAYIIITGRKKVNQDVLDLIEQNQIKAFNLRKDGAITIKIKNSKILILR